MSPIDGGALNLIGFVSSLGFLGYAAYSDLRSREVDDLVWILYGSMGLLLTLVRLLQDGGLWRILSASIVLTSAIALSMAYMGLFGGADAKAFICLSLANPVWPWSSPLLGWIHPLYPLAVLYNAYLLSAAVIPYALARNISYALRRGGLFQGFEDSPAASKLLAVLTGYKVSLGELEKGHLYPMERIVDGERRFSLLFDAEADRGELLEELKRRCEAYGVEEAWATPGLPLLAFVFPALPLTGLIGDVLVSLILKGAGLIPL
ncbi:MAG: A24 family peptidase C-terminal domain-containing protein [Candidatus Bathyarchaeia archaeon]